mmetsp:Transcript_31182/g.78111  ORF Transcript_31182/g.78111 Transcript_31182/m.78111 type:complete len:233 (-) Transcript_31182:145-843(-)|eukprot:CAMPEP_0181372516 /NCGR_PEP_ID=MMETSP1106-20121128/14781_1 /TAXON_ID=81844 /ORGANISM="Mantoniella antarctica, Strain SL-175" /LENGTH=232 /DNA_ID=CAMNT_0023489941 /DNA_START=195 /DNA_END=893 /DNA_ORIENTATION=-
MGFMDVFKKQEPKDMVRAWQSKLRTEMRGVDRQVRDIQREEKKVEKSIKDCAKRNDIRSMRLLAKEVLSSRKTTGRLHQNKAQMNSVSMMLSEQLATVRAVGHLTKSTEVLKCMNGLVKNKAICETMREMSKEMMKSGLIEEMVNDAFEEANGVEDMEAETEAEVNKVLAEMAGEHLATMPAAESHTVNLPAAETVAAETERTEAEPDAVEEEDQELNSLQARLDAIRQAAS